MEITFEEAESILSKFRLLDENDLLDYEREDAQLVSKIIREYPSLNLEHESVINEYKHRFNGEFND